VDESLNVLIVGEDARRMAAWTSWLTHAGHRVSTCPGPTLNPCPRMGAGRCLLREDADVAVVEVQGPGDERPYGEWGDHGCTTVPDDGTTVYVSQIAGPGTLKHPVDVVTLLDAIETARTPAR
jgi:hypothetical protein